MPETNQPDDAALALDYDGTLAKDGIVDPPTVAALSRWKKSGRKMMLVTGRRLESLLNVFPRIELFDIVVVENGALLYDPATAEETPLADPPPEEFVEALRGRNVPLETGRVIVATWVPHDTQVLETIRELGLELTIIYNKGAVMVLPAGVNKASGLKAALEELHISSRRTVAVGDAENDEAFMSLCGLKIAVANALPAVKELADIVTRAERGAGVAEWIHGYLSQRP